MKVRLVHPGAADMAAVAEVFDRYRHHYGEPVVAGQTLNWLTKQATAGALTVFAAHIGHDLAGIATTVALLVQDPP